MGKIMEYFIFPKLCFETVCTDFKESEVSQKEWKA